MTLAPLFRALHSANRWLIVVVALLVLVLALWGYLASRRFTWWDDRAGLVYLVLMDLQIVLGLLLLVIGSYRSLGVALAHAAVMIVAITIAHLGRWRARRIGADRLAHLLQGVSTLLSLVVILGGLAYVTLR